MKPYWTSPDGAIVVYNARFEDVLAAGVVPVRDVALIHDDPPYGTGMKSLGNKGGVVGIARKTTTSRLSGGGASVRQFPPCHGDGAAFDPSAVLALSRPTVLWGANWYASRLPDSPAWFLWDKRENVGDDDGSDGEMAWTNIGGSTRIFRHYWRGALRRTEQNDRHLHSTQKPIALCSWVYSRAKLKRGDLVFVPHGGSGPDLPACVAMGLRLIWCDVERWCCDTAIARLNAITPERAAEPAGPLFQARP